MIIAPQERSPTPPYLTHESSHYDAGGTADTAPSKVLTNEEMMEGIGALMTILKNIGKDAPYVDCETNRYYKDDVHSLNRRLADLDRLRKKWTEDDFDKLIRVRPILSKVFNEYHSVETYELSPSRQPATAKIILADSCPFIQTKNRRSHGNRRFTSRRGRSHEAIRPVSRTVK